MCNLEYQFRPGLDLEMVKKALKALKEIDVSETGGTHNVKETDDQ